MNKFALSVLVAVCITGCRPAGQTTGAVDSGCAPVGDVEYICGPHNAEDLFHIPDTPWVITSGRHMQYFNVDTRAWGVIDIIYPQQDDALDLQGCPSVLRREDAINHGIGGRVNTDKNHQLYLVSHGPRESIEIFDIVVNDSGSAPRLAWRGCVVVPHPAFGNSVAPLPDGGLVVAVTLEVNDPRAIEKLVAGQPTGYVLEWFPETGWRRLIGSEMSGNNGIEVSPDGQWVFIGNYGDGTVAKLARNPANAEQEQAQIIKLPLDHTDNLRWSPQGTLLVTAHKGPIEESIDCDKDIDNICVKDYGISEIDPDNFTIIRSIQRNGVPEVFGSATAAVRVGDKFWLGTHRGKRVASISAK